MFNILKIQCKSGNLVHIPLKKLLKNRCEAMDTHFRFIFYDCLRVGLLNMGSYGGNHDLMNPFLYNLFYLF